MAYKDKDRQRAMHKAWAEAHPEKVREMQRNYRLRHAEELRAKARERNRGRMAYIRAWEDAHREENRPRRRVYQRRYEEAVLWVNGERTNFNVAPDPIKEIAKEVKRARKVIRGEAP